MSESFTLPAFAKINLFLHVLGKREDSFHELCTVFQTISLHDSLTFTATEKEEIELTCNLQHIPTGENNLIYRAAALLKQLFSIDQGVKIHLDKQIPSPGGLGGGSADAAVALIGLVNLWQINTDINTLSKLSQQLGSDVPFFLFGGTALGTGRGTDVTEMDDFPASKMLIVTPRVNVSTADAYSLLTAPALTNEASNRNLIVCHNEAEKLITEQADLRNDFEDVVFKAEPELAQVKHSLLELGAEKVLMSGSGASIFALFSNDDARIRAFSQLKAETDWRVFDVETVSRSEYRKALGLDHGFLRK